MSMKSEFHSVEITGFWTEYLRRILVEKETLLRNLEMGKIDQPCTLGAAWQVGLRLVNGILNFPEKMIREDEEIAANP